MTSSEHSINTGSALSSRMRAAQLGWLLLAGLSIVVIAAAIPQYLTSLSLGIFDDQLLLSPGTPAYRLSQIVLFISLLSAVTAVLLAAFLFTKKRDDVMGLFLAYYLLGHGMLFAGPVEMLTPYFPNAAMVNSFILLPFFFGPMTMALITLFPDGHFVPSWSRWLIPAALIAVPASFLAGGNLGPQIEVISNWPAKIINFGLAILSIGIFGLAIYSQVFRYRRIATAEQRLQTKWVVYGLGLWFFINGITSVGWLMGLRLPQNSVVPIWLPLSSFFWISSSFILPITLTISITRYRLFEIDLLISRTLVYSLLTLGVIAIYVTVVAVLGVLFQTQANLLTAFVATAVIAVIFQPLRVWLQQGVNRLVFGRRDDPIEALAQMGSPLESALPADQVLPALVDTIATTLKLPYVAIRLTDRQGEHVATAHGRPAKNVQAFPLHFQGETLGKLLIAPRGTGLPFNPQELKLLDNVARQAGTAVHAVQLTEDLQRSRRQIVTAREEERRRLRRDLHDGLGPALAGLGLKLDAALDLVSAHGFEGEPRLLEAAELLRSLKGQTRESISGLRHIVQGLRPPVLDDLGLAAAVATYVEQRTQTLSEPAVHLQLPDDGLPPLPAAVELALYSITQEALNNVLRHARAQVCTINLDLVEEPDLKVRLEVCDDGVGLAAETKAGVGLISMRERAVELGGSLMIVDRLPKGTCVQAQIPYLMEAG